MLRPWIPFRNLLFVVVTMWFSASTALFAWPPICEEVCTTSTPCEDVCYLNMMEFENGNDITCLEYGVYDEATACCGDYVCDLEQEESCGNCTADCGPCQNPPLCGWNGCEVGENCMNCPYDCGTCGEAETCDNDGKCEDGEPNDCVDCMATGFCTQNSDCPDFQGGEYVYFCVLDRCVLQDLPSVTNTCEREEHCPNGWKCVKIPDNYHGSSYTCPGPSPCQVCVPRWVT
jgi:hypothetical protein